MRTSLLTLSLLFGVVTVAFAEQAAAPVQAEIIDVGNTVCPITGDKVSPKAFVDYEGKRYHFCCQNCVKKFKKNPEKYLAKMATGGSGEEHAGHEHAGHKHAH